MKYQLRVKDIYVVEQLGINISYLEYDIDAGYLVNHRLKQITKEKRGFHKLIKNEFEYCFKEDQCTMLLKLILEEDTISTNEDIEEYEHIEQYILIDEYIPIRNMSATEEKIERIKKPKDRIKIGDNQYIQVKYKTDENIETVYNKYGCYAIYNETLKTIYIGETITSFHTRWNNHYYNIKKSSKKKRELLMHPDTICTIVYISNGDKEETEYLEAQAIEFYKQEYPNWTVLGGTYRDNRYGRR